MKIPGPARRISGPFVPIGPTRGRRFGRTAALLLLVLSSFWPWSASGRAATGTDAPFREGSILALEADAGRRIEGRLGALERLEDRRITLRRRLAAAERRREGLAGRERDLRRMEAAIAEAFTRATRELEIARAHLEDRRRQRERAAAALMSRLYRSHGSDAADRGRIRLLLGELLRADDRPTELRRLEAERRELARARAFLSLGRRHLAAFRPLLEETIVVLRKELARLTLTRQETVRRLAAARRHRQELRRLALTARRLARLAVRPVPLLSATRAAFLDTPLPVPPRRDLRLPVRLAATGPARLPSPSLPPTLSGAVVADGWRPPILPVDGRILSRFGDEEAGALARGITIRVDRDQPVRAVRGGRVVFAQPFRQFGLVLILDHGDGYHTLLAGMTRLDVRRGDLIAAGAVVGRMERSRGEEARLYIELRQQGRPVNPLPWLAARADRTRG